MFTFDNSICLIFNKNGCLIDETANNTKIALILSFNKNYSIDNYTFTIYIFLTNQSFVLTDKDFYQLIKGLYRLMKVLY